MREKQALQRMRHEIVRSRNLIELALERQGCLEKQMKGGGKNV